MNQHNAACFNLNADAGNLHFEKLLPAEGSSARLTLYEKNVGNLPLPPALWNAFQRACNEGASSQELGRIIKADPVMAAAILRSANSAGLGLRVPVNDIGRAIARLGHSTVRSVVASHCFSTGSKTPGKVYDLPLLWKHGMAVSALAEIVAHHIPGCDADEAGTLGLFHDIGRMGLNLITEFMQPAELDTEKGHLVYECQRFGCTHVDMGKILARHWQLPDKIIRGISCHHQPAYDDAESIPADIRKEVLAVFLADLLVVKLNCAGGNPCIVLPHVSFAAMLPNTTLMDLANDRKAIAELALIQAIEF